MAEHFKLSSLSIFVTSVFTAHAAYPAKTNYGREFLVAFPPSGHGKRSDSVSVLQLHMATYKAKVEVTITPAPTVKSSVRRKLQNYGYPEQVTVRRGEVTMITLNSAIKVSNDYRKLIQDKVVHIKGDGDIILLAMDSPFAGGSEAYTVLPLEALGKTYCVATSRPEPAESKILVVSYTVTVIEIQYPEEKIDAWANISGSSARPGKRVRVLIPAFKLYVLTPNDDRATYCIYASHPVAVIVGAAWTAVGEVRQGQPPKLGNLVEQITPTNKWGSKTIVPRLSDGLVRFNVAEILILSKPLTTVNTELADGSSTAFKTRHLVHKAVLHSGKETVSAVVTSQNGSHAVLLYMTSTRSRHSPVLVFVPPVEQFRTDYLFIVPNVTSSMKPVDPYENAIHVIVQPKYMNSLWLDGQPFPKDVDLLSAPHSSPWISISQSIDPGPHIIRLIKPNTKFGLIVYGYNIRGDAYGFFGGMHLGKIVNCTASLQAIGDGVDNDCDSRVDEELENGFDDDNDGRIDEDNADVKREYLLKPVDGIVNKTQGDDKQEGPEVDASREGSGSSKSGYNPMNEMIGPIVGAIVGLAAVGSVITVYIYKTRKTLTLKDPVSLNFARNSLFQAESPSNFSGFESDMYVNGSEKSVNVLKDVASDMSIIPPKRLRQSVYEMQAGGHTDKLASISLRSPSQMSNSPTVSPTSLATITSEDGIRSISIKSEVADESAVEESGFGREMSRERTVSFVTSRESPSEKSAQASNIEEASDSSGWTDVTSEVTKSIQDA